MPLTQTQTLTVLPPLFYLASITPLLVIATDTGTDTDTDSLTSTLLFSINFQLTTNYSNNEDLLQWPEIPTRFGSVKPVGVISSMFPANQHPEYAGWLVAAQLAVDEHRIISSIGNTFFHADGYYYYTRREN